MEHTYYGRATMATSVRHAGWRQPVGAILVLLIAAIPATLAQNGNSNGNNGNNLSCKLNLLPCASDICATIKGTCGGAAGPTGAQGPAGPVRNAHQAESFALTQTLHALGASGMRALQLSWHSHMHTGQTTLKGQARACATCGNPSPPLGPLVPCAVRRSALLALLAR